MKKVLLSLAATVLLSCNQGKELPVAEYLDSTVYPDWATSDWYNYNKDSGTPLDTKVLRCCIGIDTLDPTSTTTQKLTTVACRDGTRLFLKDPLKHTYHQIHSEEPINSNVFPILQDDYLIVRHQGTHHLIRYKRIINDSIHFANVDVEGFEVQGFGGSITWDNNGLFVNPDPGGVYTAGYKDLVVKGYVNSKTNSRINANINEDHLVSQGKLQLVINEKKCK